MGKGRRFPERVSLSTKIYVPQRGIPVTVSDIGGSNGLGVRGKGKEIETPPEVAKKFCLHMCIMCYNFCPKFIKTPRLSENYSLASLS